MSIKLELPFDIGQEIWVIEMAYDKLGYRIANSCKINNYMVTDYVNIYFDKPSGGFNYDVVVDAIKIGRKKYFAGCTFEVDAFTTKEEAIRYAKGRGYIIIED